jgi:hypothetical protein
VGGDGGFEKGLWMQIHMGFGFRFRSGSSRFPGERRSANAIIRYFHTTARLAVTIHVEISDNRWLQGAAVSVVPCKMCKRSSGFAFSDTKCTYTLKRSEVL